MAPPARRLGKNAAAAAASPRRSARLAAQRTLPAAVVPRTTPRRRRPFLPFRRSHDQACIAREVARHQVLFVHAWPGTGKSSQVPRVLHSAGHGPVICSQTYRLADESAAAHAGADMRAGEVAVALDGRAPAGDTAAAVTYATHHALLRELAADPVLARYGAVVIDEADDGMLLTSAVLGLVRSAAARRPDLRVVICTRGTLFFGEDAVHAFFPGAEHLWFDTDLGVCPWEYVGDPVTDTDHVAAAVATVRRIHGAEPPGDVLVFVPSRADVEAADRLLLAAPLTPGIVTRRLHDGVPAHLVGDVLAPTPDGERKVVLATDIADSAVFVEGIRYIVDSGYRCTDNVPPSLTGGRSPPPPARMFRALKTSVRSGYHIKGRDNRGKCFCLYTIEESAEMMQTGCSPLRTRTDDVDSLASIVLVLKDLGIAGGNGVEGFEFMLPPRPEMLRRAVAVLVAADAVGSDGEVTNEGRRMVREILGRCYF
ncbi:unnamed protein product [Urochloa decumbens]|uniref:Helicase C-terminal domain-containing protein n=1 Tax=Urochloa decumbens TaxID=240449 RepID=A0ABC9B797_9POAL